MSDTRLVYPENARNEEYRRQLEEILAAGVCPFCPEHLGTYKSEPIIIEGLFWRVTKVDPHVSYEKSGALGHIMLVCRFHVRFETELTIEAMAEFHEFKRRITKELGLPHCTLIMHEGGPATGQTVAHLHAQLVSAGEEPILTRV